jgi:murein DD-endopeptidase MepM/ murein hydrolase activator NlpD
MDAQPIVTAATATATAPPVCVVPFGWVTYTVQAGDSLASIAARNGITIMQLLQGNCLSVNETVTPGSMVYVPSFPTQATRPDSSSQQFVAQGCTDPYVLILSPVPGQRISGLYFIRGTANPANFAYYRLELRPDSVNVFSFYARSEQAVDNGVLGSIDTTAFSPGLYWLRLSIIDRSGGVSAAFCTVPVFFE